MEKLSAVTALAVPAIIALVSVYALRRGVDVFGAFTDGAKRGLAVAGGILPSLVALLAAVYLLRASGLTEAMSALAAPLLNKVGIPPEVAPLVFIRPISGSGAMAAAAAIIAEHGVDSLIGRTAAVMLGSTETTFYVISVYFGSLGITKTRWAILAALAADAVGFVSAAVFTRMFFA